MPVPYERTRIRNMELKNRFVRSATIMRMANEDGSCTSPLVETMRTLSSGGVGLAITGYAYVTRGGKSNLNQLGCYSDDLIPGLTRMTSAVHSAGAKVALQIVHCGLFSRPELTGEPVIGPSVMEGDGGPVGVEMTGAEIRATTTAFGAAAARGKASGFDAVQVHAAHGYLLSQFLSPYFNKRKDQYGGSVESRARFLVEVVHDVRDAVGPDYPILVKMNAEDRLEGGLVVRDMVAIARMLQSAGVDAIEISGGTALAFARKEMNSAPFRIGTDEVVYWRAAAEAYKAEVDVPLMLVGGIRSYETATELVRDGIADYISLSRPLIREPGLIERWRSERAGRSKCVSDNACLSSGRDGNGVRCVHLE